MFQKAMNTHLILIIVLGRSPRNKSSEQAAQLSSQTRWAPEKKIREKQTKEIKIEKDTLAFLHNKTIIVKNEENKLERKKTFIIMMLDLKDALRARGMGRREKDTQK